MQELELGIKTGRAQKHDEIVDFLVSELNHPFIANGITEFTEGVRFTLTAVLNHLKENRS